jgi:hypothetical protein
MSFENFVVNRVILHEVFRRNDERQVVPPRYGGQLVVLSPDAEDVFRSRVIDAMGSSSQSMEMAISDVADGSGVHIAHSLVGATDGEFTVRSQAFADRLARVQVSRMLPGGILIVFDGHIGAAARRIVGILKAETHGGFRRQVDNGRLTVSFFNDLFLSPQTKLYKIGVFVQDAIAPFPGGWQALVYDSLMSAGNRQAAAQYFYEQFLGCKIPDNSPQLTKKFFDATRDFIKGLNVSEEDKSDLLTGLYTYVKVDNSPTIQVSAFANNYLDVNVRDQYAASMAEAQFPTIAVNKDTSDLKNTLKNRKVSFSRSIKLTAPPDAFEELVQLQSLEGAGPDGETWTKIVIRDRIRDQE